MTVTIDSAGRIVVPKSVRDKLGLAAGTEMELEEQDGMMTLVPANRTSPLVKKNGRWVFTGKLPSGFDLTKFIEEEREAHIRESGGW